MYKSGDWLALCDVCQHRYYASELRKRWDGYMVCKHDWEPRHPLDFLRVRPEHSFPSFIRTETDPEITITTAATSVNATITNEDGDPVIGIRPNVANLTPHIISISTPSLTNGSGVSTFTVTPLSIGQGKFNLNYNGVYSNFLTLDVEGA